MRRLALITAIALMAFVSPALGADPMLRGPWQVTVLDGASFPVFATLWFDESGAVGGQGPCNSFTTANTARLPELALSAISATEMACKALDLEIAYFATLATMRTATLLDQDRLLLQATDGRTLMFQRLIVILDN